MPFFFELFSSCLRRIIGFSYPFEQGKCLLSHFIIGLALSLLGDPFFFFCLDFFRVFLQIWMLILFHLLSHSCICFFFFWPCVHALFFYFYKWFSSPNMTNNEVVECKSIFNVVVQRSALVLYNGLSLLEGIILPHRLRMASLFLKH